MLSFKNFFLFTMDMKNTLVNKGINEINKNWIFVVHHL